MSTSFNVRLVPFDRRFLDLSWQWLNDPEIKQLTLTPDFTRKDQEQFFESLPTRTDYHVWGVEILEGLPIGAGGIKNIVGNSGEFWCYIGERDWWGAGIGGEILTLCEEKARGLGVRDILMIAAKDNFRSIQAFRKIGFVADETFHEEGLVRLTKVLT